MALFLDTSGDVRFIKPKNDSFSLDELYKLIGCNLIETIYVYDDCVLIFDEEGKLSGKPINFIGSFLLAKNGGMPNDMLVGRAILAKNSELK